MEATHLSVAPGGGPAPAGPVTVRSRAPGSEPGIFRELRYLRLAPGVGAEELVIDAGECVLEGRFLPYTYNAIPASAGDLRASVTNAPSGSGGGLIVALDAPRRVRAIVVQGTINVPAPYELQIHRLDGNTPSDEPSLRATVATYAHVEAVFKGGGQAGGSGFVWVGAGAGAGSATAAAAGATGGTSAMMYSMTSTPPATSGAGAHTGGGQQMVFLEEQFMIAGSSDLAFAIDFTDRRFLVRVRGSNGQMANLNPSRLGAVTVEAFPRSPRVALAFPAPGAAADPAAANSFWRVGGEIGNGASLADGEVSAGPAMGAEIARAAARYVERMRDQNDDDGAPPTLPPTLDIAMLIESDAPCRFTLDSVRVPYRMARESFPDGSEKQVLRFGAGRIETRELGVPVPAGATIHSAALVTVESLRGDRVGGAGAETMKTIGPSGTGVRVHPEMRAAQPLTPARASLVSGVMVGVSAITPRISVAAELREDAEGTPTGRLLGKGTFEMVAAGRPAWQIIRFEKPIVVPAAPHWIVLTSDAGPIVWLTEEGIEEDALHLLRKDGAEGWATSHLARGQRTLHDLLTTGGAQAADVRAFELSIAGITLPVGATASGDRTTYDMAEPVSAFLAGQAASGSGMVTLPLRCSALGPGSVTIYPPRIEFDR